MIPQATHRTFGTSLEEWIQLTPNELDVDDVSLEQIVGPLRHDFGLEGEALRSAIASVVELLVARGAILASGGDNPDSQKLWASMANSTAPLAARLMQYIDALGRDPNSRDLWLTLP